MELIAAVAIGLNPFVASFVLAGLAAFTPHVPQNPAFGNIPSGVFTLMAVLFGLAAPIDFVLGKFVRFAPAVRRVSQYVAPVAAALFAANVAQWHLPLPVVASAAAIIAWAVSAMLTSLAARASRSPAWVGLGHIPLLMSAATAAACIVPLGLAKPWLGLSLVGLSVAPLLWCTLTARRPASARASVAAVPAARRRVTLAGRAVAR